MPATFSGSCLCRQLQFTFEGPTLWAAHCHCRLCQRAHGAPLVTWVGVAEDRFRLTAQDTLQWYRSSPGAQRGFCRECGSTLFFRSSRWPGEIHIVRSNIEGELDREPDGHAYWESHATWFPFEDSLPRPASQTAPDGGAGDSV